MDHPSWCDAERRSLEERGLVFDAWESPDGALRFLVPRGWRVEWRDDHAVVKHGVPPQGFLTVYPLPGAGSRRLVTAFLNEFVGPAVDHLDIQQLGHLPDLPDVEAGLFQVDMAGHRRLGVALATHDRGLDVVVGYWVDEALFRKPLVTSLVKVVLGSVDVSPASPLQPPLPRGILPLDPTALWEEEIAEEEDDTRPWGAREARVALRLPPGWQVEAWQEAGEQGWLFFPPDTGPDDPHLDVLIALTSEDLFGSLEDTLAEALSRLDPQRTLRLERPPMVVEDAGRRGIGRLLVGHPAPGEAAGAARRLWSMGWTDEASVVHLVALAQANRLAGLMGDLTRIARSLRLLPRPVDLDRMAEMVGCWRYQTYPDPREMSVGTEFVYTLRADGTFTASVEERFIVAPDQDALRLHQQIQAGGPRVVAVTGPAAERWGAGAVPGAEMPPEPPPPAEAPDPGPVLRDGTWDITGDRLTLRYTDGGVELRALGPRHGRMAQVDGMLWERRADAGEPRLEP